MPSHDGHRTVLLHEAVDILSIRDGDTVVDGTIGGAGHMRAILERVGSKGQLFGFDLDKDAIERAEDIFESDARVHLIQANFRYLDRELEQRGVERIDRALFDLGWSSFQLADGRGFSFRSDEPLSMAYNREQTLTASTIVNEWQEETIADILYGWGEETYSRRIAEKIVHARERSPISTARELAELIWEAVPAGYRHGRIHPATKTFQALRIAVNDELGALNAGVRAAWKMLAPGGRIAVISFHSIEDRVVKRLFLELAKDGGQVITKKPQTPTPDEVKENSRARSAKLRAIQKNI